MWAIPVVSLCHRFTFGSLFSYQNLRNFPCPTLCRDTGLHPQINPDTKLNCSTAVTKGSWDRLSNPATGRCKWKPTSPRKWCSDLSWVLYALVFSSGATLHAQTQDKVLEQAASTSSRVKKVRQLGCKANKWKECGLCCASHSLLASEVKKQSVSWREASCLAMWADNRRLWNSRRPWWRGGGEGGKKEVVIFVVRQCSMAALKDGSYRKSFIICRKCLLSTGIERRNGSSCWPQPISYIIICLQDLLARLSCFSSIKCNGIPRAFTCSVFHHRRRGCGQMSCNIFRVFCITCTDACSYSSPAAGL